MNNTIIDFFLTILSHDENVRKEIEKFQGQVYFSENEQGEKNVLVFSLKGLHELLIALKKTDVINSNYSEFQKSLYQSNINEQLQQQGGKIEVHLSKGKIDENFYRLIQMTTESTEIK